jgi:hypothetical protein
MRSGVPGDEIMDKELLWTCAMSMAFGLVIVAMGYSLAGWFVFFVGCGAFVLECVISTIEFLTRD